MATPDQNDDPGNIAQSENVKHADRARQFPDRDRDGRERQQCARHPGGDQQDIAGGGARTGLRWLRDGCDRARIERFMNLRDSLPRNCRDFCKARFRGRVSPGVAQGSASRVQIIPIASAPPRPARRPQAHARSPVEAASLREAQGISRIQAAVDRRSRNGGFFPSREADFAAMPPSGSPCALAHPGKIEGIMKSKVNRRATDAAFRRQG